MRRCVRAVAQSAGAATRQGSLWRAVRGVLSRLAVEARHSCAPWRLFPTVCAGGRPYCCAIVVDQHQRWRLGDWARYRRWSSQDSGILMSNGHDQLLTTAPGLGSLSLGHEFGVDNRAWPRHGTWNHDASSSCGATNTAKTQRGFLSLLFRRQGSCIVRELHRQRWKLQAHLLWAESNEWASRYNPLYQRLQLTRSWA